MSHTDPTQAHTEPEGDWLFLCHSQELLEASEAVPFDVLYAGQTLRAFALRFEGQVYAYLNRCTHLPQEMDFQPNRFLDNERRWIICASHGAMYEPSTGLCVGGPGHGALTAIAVREQQGRVYWRTAFNLKPVEFL